MYIGPYLVLFSQVFLSVQDVVPIERTIKVSLTEMVFPHLPWHFDMVFGNLVPKCSSNYIGRSTRGSENRISSAEELFSWLPPSASFAIFISCLSITQSDSDWPDRIRWCCPGFFQRLMVSERRHSTMVHIDWNLFTRSLRLASD